MTSNLKFRLLTIIAVILICVYGIIGLPKSKAELIQNWKQNIRLGLDLSGGSHLIIEIHLQDAFKGEADAVIARLKDELGKASITFADMNHNDPQTIADAGNIQINISGVPGTLGGRLPADRERQFRGWLDSDAGESDRLPDESEAERGPEDQGRHDHADQGYDREQD